MKICFFDIETVPTEPSLQENGLLDEQIQLDEADFKKAQPLRCDRKNYLPLLRYRAIGHRHSRSIAGRRDRDHQKLLEARRRLQSLRRPQYSRLRPAVYLSALGHPSDQTIARHSFYPLPQRADLRHDAGVEQMGPRTRQPRLAFESPRHPSPKEHLDGSKVYPYYRAGKIAEIVEYCKRDVDSVRQVYRRLTFTAGPSLV